VTALDPDMLVAVPTPVAGQPALNLDAIRRQDRHDFDSGRRRRGGHVDLGSQLGKGRAGHDCSPRGNGQRAEQAATREALHRGSSGFGYRSNDNVDARLPQPGAAWGVTGLWPLALIVADEVADTRHDLLASLAAVEDAVVADPRLLPMHTACTRDVRR